VRDSETLRARMLLCVMNSGRKIARQRRAGRGSRVAPWRGRTTRSRAHRPRSPQRSSQETTRGTDKTATATSRDSHENTERTHTKLHKTERPRGHSGHGGWRTCACTTWLGPHSLASRRLLPRGCLERGELRLESLELGRRAVRRGEDGGGRSGGRGGGRGLVRARVRVRVRVRV
jgi:hypothetical protein